MSTSIYSPIRLNGDYPNLDGRYMDSNGNPFVSVAAAETYHAGKMNDLFIGFTVIVKESGWPKAKEYWVQPKGTMPETYGLVLKGSSDIDITTEQIEGGTRVIITDAEGTVHSFDVKDGASYSTGYYYGQYTSENELPQQTSMKGYAYVATQDPAVYYVYTISGEGGTWENSGEKFVTTQLETNLASKSQTKAPTTKIVAEGIESVDVTAQQSFTKSQKETARTNIGAQEDITSMQNVQPVVAALNDRAADVDQQTSVVKALGYKVLNPNLSFASQVESTQSIDNSNMIFEIRDNFTLSSSTVTIPANCTLFFNGGMLSSGTIIGNNTKIKDTSVKIFSGITLGSGGTWNIDYFRPEWWGAKADGETDNSAYFHSSFYYGSLFKIPLKLSAGTYRCVPIRRQYNYAYTNPAASTYIYTCVLLANVSNLTITGDKTRILVDTSSIIDNDNYDQSFFLYINRYYRITLQNISFIGKTKTGEGVDSITVGTTTLTTAATIMKNYASIVGCDPVGRGAGLTLDGVDVDNAYNVVDFEYYVAYWNRAYPTAPTNVNGDTNILSNARVTAVASVYKIYKLSQAVSNQIANCSFHNVFDGVVNADCFMSWDISRCSVTSPSAFLVQNGNTTNTFYTNKVTFNTCKFEFVHVSPNWGNISEAGIIKQKKGCPGVDILLSNTSIGGGGNYVVDWVAMTLAGNSHITFVGGFFNAGIRIWPGATNMQVYNGVDGGYPNIIFINVPNPSPLNKIDHLKEPVADTYRVIYLGRENKSYVFGNYPNKYREVLTPMSQLDIDASKVIEDGTVIFDGSKPTTGYTGMRGYDKAIHQWLTLETVSLGNFGKWYNEQGQAVIDNTGTLSERCASTPNVGDTYLQEEEDESILRRFVTINNFVGHSVNGANGSILDNSNCTVFVFDIEDLVGTNIIFPQMYNPSNGLAGWATYNKSNIVLTKGQYPSGTPNYGVGTNKTITVPANAKWLKITFGKNYVGSLFLKSTKVYLIYDSDGFWKEGMVSTAKVSNFVGIITGEVLGIHYDLKDTLDNIGVYGTSSYIGFQALIADTDTSINGLVIKWNGTKWIKSNGEDLKVAIPVITFSDSGSTHTATIECATTSATIYYTLDGTDPTSSSTEYTEEINLVAGNKLKCIAIRNYMVNSDIAQQKLSSPTISVVNRELTIESHVSGATIYYTLDGTDPDSNSAVYTNPVSIQSGTTVNAIAIMAGRLDSDIVTETYLESANE